MRSFVLFRPLLLACLSCTWILPTARGQEEKPVNINVQGELNRMAKRRI